MVNKKTIILSVGLVFAVMFISISMLNKPCANTIFTGAFLSDRPSAANIEHFRVEFGRKPYFVLVFVDWGKFVDPAVVSGVYDSQSVLLVSWEPWDAMTKAGIDYQGIISGKFDDYISKFASSLKLIGKQVFVRFAHEPNGDWYPWSGKKIGAQTYISMCRHIRQVFDKNKAGNVSWIYSVNWEDVPVLDNHFLLYYPGDNFIDYVGIDGYNWGRTQSWSKWMGFKEIFSKRYYEAIQNIPKPVIISEFSSTSKGGNKAEWIKQALDEMKQMRKVAGFIVFNVDKESDWSFAPGTIEARQFKKSLASRCFKEEN